MFCEKGVQKICIKFRGKHQWQGAISIKLFCNFIEISLFHGCSLVNLMHILRTPLPENSSGGLLLYPATSLKERTPTQVFSDEFWEVLKTPF